MSCILTLLFSLTETQRSSSQHLTNRGEHPGGCASCPQHPSTNNGKPSQWCKVNYDNFGLRRAMKSWLHFRAPSGMASESPGIFPIHTLGQALVRPLDVQGLIETQEGGSSPQHQCCPHTVEYKLWCQESTAGTRGSNCLSPGYNSKGRAPVLSLPLSYGTDLQPEWAL